MRANGGVICVEQEQHVWECQVVHPDSIVHSLDKGRQLGVAPALSKASSNPPARIAKSSKPLNGLTHWSIASSVILRPGSSSAIRSAGRMVGIALHCLWQSLLLVAGCNGIDVDRGGGFGCCYSSS
jgi:hypothetical protein